MKWYKVTFRVITARDYDETYTVAFRSVSDRAASVGAMRYASERFPGAIFRIINLSISDRRPL